MNQQTGGIVVATDEMELATEVGRLPPFSVALTVWDDGQSCLRSVARSIIGGLPPALVVLDLSIGRPDAAATARLIRAVEAGIGAESLVPILLYTTEPADQSTQHLLEELGRAVHLQKAPARPSLEHARTLAVAIGRLVDPGKGVS